MHKKSDLKKIILVKLWLLKIFKNIHDFGTFKFLNLVFWLFEASKKEKGKKDWSDSCCCGRNPTWWWWGHCKRPQDYIILTYCSVGRKLKGRKEGRGC